MYQHDYDVGFQLDMLIRANTNLYKVMSVGITSRLEATVEYLRSMLGKVFCNDLSAWICNTSACQLQQTYSFEGIIS